MVDHGGPGRARTQPKLGWASFVLALCGSLGAGCIFPDEDIRFVDRDQNEFAVRFVESTSMTTIDRCACSESLGLPACEELGDPDDRGLRCPVATLASLPRFMDPNVDAFDFCGCPEGERDSRALPPLDDIWVEDLDRADNEPKDSLYAALLLDMPNDPLADPTFRVAYRNLLNPDAVLPIETNANAVIPNTKLLLQPEPQMRQVVISNPATDSVDLCNDAGVGGGRLDEGWHTLTLVVTDRPWVTVNSGDEDGGQPDIIKHGVPDVAANATWVTRQWAFHCSDVENNTDCSCEAPD